MKTGEETTKRQCRCDVTGHGVITDAAAAFLGNALDELTGEDAPET